jgi:hypothetical protein
VTNEELSALLKDKSQEWRDGFFAAINLSTEMKAAFLRSMIGQEVTVSEVKP